MKKYSSAALAAMATMIAAPAAIADGLYYGLSFGISSAESQPNAVTTSHSEGLFPTFGGVLGYRMDRDTFFYGGEVNADVAIGAEFSDSVTGAPCRTAASGPYYCRSDGTVRLRGIAGRNLGNNLEGFASLGVAMMRGDGAVSTFQQNTGLNVGLTLGVGVQKEMAQGQAVRWELIYDKLDGSAKNPTIGATSYSPDYEAISLQVSLLLGK